MTGGILKLIKILDAFLLVVMNLPSLTDMEMECTVVNMAPVKLTVLTP